ncbi:hypothetical protein V5O48_017613 [Marasmius crinis-equi]|uniref:Uncharacterized protein n=1 Tax=Marasmius crinis-equi TaxID=585013 RepID=A0ABR3ENH4_9AGAR
MASQRSQQGPHISPGPISPSRRRRVIIVFEDTESDASTDTEHDIDWATQFGALTISPENRTPPSTDNRTSTRTPPPPYSTSSAVSAPPAASPPSLTPLEQYYCERYGNLVPSPNQITTAGRRTSKYYVVTRGIRVGVFSLLFIALLTASPELPTKGTERFATLETRTFVPMRPA